MDNSNNRQRTIIIVVVVVVLLLCCCCLVGGVVAWNFGDSFLEALGIKTTLVVPLTLLAL